MKKYIGEIGVDAGCVMVGDPCYMHGEDGELKKAYPTWEKLCAAMPKRRDEGGQLNYALGHKGLGVIVQTTHGDGVLPVFLETDENGRRKLIVELG